MGDLKDRVRGDWRDFQSTLCGEVYGVDQVGRRSMLVIFNRKGDMVGDGEVVVAHWMSQGSWQGLFRDGIFWTDANVVGWEIGGIESS